MDRSGDIALGFNASSLSEYPRIRMAARKLGDVKWIPKEWIVANSKSSQEGEEEVGGKRWGDYSSMVIDPTDDTTFCYTEYLPAAKNGSYNWSTRIVAFQIKK